MINDNLLNADGFAFECPLADSLDSSLKGLMGISGGISKEGNETYYNTSDNFHGADALTPEQMLLIQQGLATGTAVASGVIQKRAIQGICKKPLIRENPTNRKKWSEYRACLDREEKKRADELAIEQAKAAAALAAAQSRGGSGLGNDDDDKILGMPKNLAIGIGVVLGLTVVGFVGYKIVKAKKV